MKTEIKYSLLTTVVLVVWVMAEHFLGFNTTKMEIGEYTRFFSALAPLILLYFGIREKRNKELRGQLTFMQGLKTAFWISFFFAILQGLWFTLYSNAINPEYAALMIQFKQKQLEMSGKTPEQISNELMFTKKVFDGGWNQFGFFILTTTVTNTLIGLLMTLFLKRRPPVNPAVPEPR